MEGENVKFGKVPKIKTRSVKAIWSSGCYVVDFVEYFGKYSKYSSTGIKIHIETAFELNLELEYLLRFKVKEMGAGISENRYN